MDCPICLSSAVFPVQLKCKHIFCYLCVKGLQNSSRKCPLCRKAIHKNLLVRPKFVRRDVHSDRPDFDGQQWFYEGKAGTGFWAYDFINGRLLEEAYNSDTKLFEIMISGVEYCVDFVQQIQYRKDCPSRKRKIRRDLLTNINVFKGIAGVPKHLLRDLYSTQSDTTSDTNQRNSGQLMSANNDTEDNGQQIAKKIKVEVKEEPQEVPDSTTD